MRSQLLDHSDAPPVTKATLPCNIILLFQSILTFSTKSNSDPSSNNQCRKGGLIFRKFQHNFAPFLPALNADVPERPDPKAILNQSLGEADDAFSFVKASNFARYWGENKMNRQILAPLRSDCGMSTMISLPKGRMISRLR